MNQINREMSRIKDENLKLRNALEDCESDKDYLETELERVKKELATINDKLADTGW